MGGVRLGRFVAPARLIGVAFALCLAWVLVLCAPGTAVAAEEENAASSFADAAIEGKADFASSIKSVEALSKVVMVGEKVQIEVTTEPGVQATEAWVESSNERLSMKIELRPTGNNKFYGEADISRDWPSSDMWRIEWISVTDSMGSEGKVWNDVLGVQGQPTKDMRAANFAIENSDSIRPEITHKTTDFNKGIYCPLGKTDDVQWLISDESVLQFEGTELQGPFENGRYEQLLRYIPRSPGSTAVYCFVNGNLDFVTYVGVTYADPIDINKTTVRRIDAEYEYTGKAICPEPAVSFSSGGALKEGRDYEVSYENNVEPGTATVVIKAIGNAFTGEKRVDFRIVESGSIDINNAVVAGAFPSYEYTGEEICPGPVVSVGGRELKEGVHYELSYRNNVNPGTAIVVIQGKGDYTGIKEVEFEIVRPIFEAEFGFDVRDEAQEISFELGEWADVDWVLSNNYVGETGGSDVYEKWVGGGSRIMASVDFAPLRPGRTELCAYVDGNLRAKMVITVLVGVPIDLGETEISGIEPQYEFVGEEVCPKPVITFKGRLLEEGLDYELLYENNSAPGMATVVVSSIHGAYVGEMRIGFQIIDGVALEFYDVAPGAWYYEPVMYAASHGLVQGYGDTGFFGPDDTLTRAQAAMILCRYFAPEVNLDVYEGNRTGMSDVEGYTWYTNAANWAVSTGVIGGRVHPDGAASFDPHDTITREELCTMIARAASSFRGANIAGADWSAMLSTQGHDEVSPWASESVAWCMDNSVVNGVSEPDGRHVRPQGVVTRATMAQVMMNAIEGGVM